MIFYFTYPSTCWPPWFSPFFLWIPFQHPFFHLSSPLLYFFFQNITLLTHFLRQIFSHIFRPRIFHPKFSYNVSIFSLLRILFFTCFPISIFLQFFHYKCFTEMEHSKLLVPKLEEKYRISGHLRQQLRVSRVRLIDPSFTRYARIIIYKTKNS